MILSMLTDFMSYPEFKKKFLELQSEIDRLRLENSHLRKENRQLRRLLKNREMRLLNKARMSATFIGALWFAKLPITLESCKSAGLPERSFYLGKALLLTARIYEDSSITVNTPEDFERALNTAYNRIEQNGITMLNWRIPLSRQYKESY